MPVKESCTDMLPSQLMETIIPCVDYVESHMNKISSDALSDSDLINMLGGDGGCQVDVVLYLISHSKSSPSGIGETTGLTRTEMKP